jgi:hypothetical protein
MKHNADLKNLIGHTLVLPSGPIPVSSARKTIDFLRGMPMILVK